MLKKNMFRIKWIMWEIITLPIAILGVFLWCLMALLWKICRCGTVLEYWNLCEGYYFIEAYKQIFRDIKNGEEFKEEEA